MVQESTMTEEGHFRVASHAVVLGALSRDPSPQIAYEPYF